MSVQLKIEKGAFVRTQSGFRNWVTPDGSAGPSGSAGFAAESGRYHLYISHACPWAHRTMIYRALKGLEDHISVSVVHPLMPEESWVFGTYPGTTEDHVNGASKMSEVYLKADPDFNALVTVPVLWDKNRQTIVNNESSEIIRMLNSSFDEFGHADVDFYPPELQPEIDQINDLVYDNLLCGAPHKRFYVE